MTVLRPAPAAAAESRERLRRTSLERMARDDVVITRLRPFDDGTHELIRFRAPSALEQGRDTAGDESAA